MKHWTAILLVLAGTLPALARAHGGEDHGKPASTPAATAQGQSVGATGETFEVLVKAPAAEPGHAVELRVFVADARTNAPIQDATVEVDFLGASEVKLTATPAGSPGIYTGTVTLPTEGDWEVMATVGQGDTSEVLALGPLKVAEPMAGAEHSHATGFRWKRALLGLVGLVLAAAAVWNVRRTLRSRRAPQGVPHV